MTSEPCQWLKSFERKQNHVFFFSVKIISTLFFSLEELYLSPVVLTASIIPLQIDAFQHMQHFVQTMQQQAQHAIATEDQQHKQELHKLMARSVQSWGTLTSVLELKAFLSCRVPAADTFQTLIKRTGFLF